jgi:ribosomal protein L22
MSESKTKTLKSLKTNSILLEMPLKNTNVFREYLKQKVHRKPLTELLSKIKGKSLVKIYQFMNEIYFKKRVCSSKYKYPIKATVTLYRLLKNAESSLKAKNSSIKNLYIENSWTTKGASRGVGSIPRARGRSTPKYFPSTNLYIEFRIE